MDFVLEAAVAEGDESFPTPVLESMRRMIRCDAVSYREWGARGVLEFSIAADDPEAWVRVWSAYPRVRRDDPIPGGPAGPADERGLPAAEWIGRPLALTDLVCDRELRRRELYVEICKPLGVRSVLKLFLPTEGASGASFVFDTSRQRFTDADRLVLQRVLPHLVQLRRNATARRRCAERMRAADGAAAEKLGRLTPREHVVLARAAAGETNGEIARALFVGPPTVRKHLEHVYEKLEVRNRAAAAALFASIESRGPG